MQGGDPRQLKLNHLDIWIQLHNMASGFKSERVVRDIANHIGVFVESDPQNFKGVWRDFLRVRVSIRVDQPLKIKMMLEKAGGAVCQVHFRYEDLPTFCFICGILGHSDRFCDAHFTMQRGTKSLSRTVLS